MARKIGVLCAGCGKQIEIDDEYVPGIRGGQLATNVGLPEQIEIVYKNLPKSIQAKIPHLAIRPWQKTLTCENPDCRQTHAYGSRDLRLYDDESSGA